MPNRSAIRAVASWLWFIAITSLWIATNREFNLLDLNPRQGYPWQSRVKAGWIVRKVTVPKFGQRVVRVELEPHEGLAPIDNVTVTQRTKTEQVAEFGVEAEPAEEDQTASVFTFALSRQQGTQECRLKIATPEAQRVADIRVSSHVPHYQTLAWVISTLFYLTGGWFLTSLLGFTRWVWGMPAGGVPSTSSGHHSPEK